MSAILKHIITEPDETSGGSETYLIKLKDKKEQQGIKISDGGKPMNIIEFRIVKVSGENNKIVVQIIKDKADAAFIIKRK